MTKIGWESESERKHRDLAGDLRNAAQGLPEVRTKGMLEAHGTMVKDAIESVGHLLTNLAGTADTVADTIHQHDQQDYKTKKRVEQVPMPPSRVVET